MPKQNSFRLNLEEVVRMISAPIFCINVVVNHRQEIAAAFAGDPIECRRAAVDFKLRISDKRIGGRADAVITSSYPMDINFKQGMKCVGNTLPAVRPGGRVIAFMRAERGIDDIVPPEKSTPLWLAKTVLRTIGPWQVLGFFVSADDPQEIVENAAGRIGRRARGRLPRGDRELFRCHLRVREGEVFRPHLLQSVFCFM